MQSAVFLHRSLGTLGETYSDDTSDVRLVLYVGRLAGEVGSIGCAGADDDAGSEVGCILLPVSSSITGTSSCSWDYNTSANMYNVARD